MHVEKNRVVLLSIVSNSVLIVFKVAAGVMMGSVAVLSEAVHSGIDLLASVVAFFAVNEAEKPADAGHPYGHGKFENISGFLEALLILAAAGFIISGAIRKLIAPPAVMENLDWGIGVMAISLVVNLFVSFTLFRSAKKHDSIAIEADALHLGVDVFTSLGVMAGLVVIRFTHWVALDPLIAIAVAGLILRASVDLIVRSVADLADHKLPDQEVVAIEAIIRSHSEILDFHKLRTRKSGPRREIDLHIEIDANTPLSAAHDLCSRLEEAISAELPGANVIVHVEPEPHETCG